MNNQFINTRNIFIMATIAIISFALGFFVNNYTSEGNLIADDNKEIVFEEKSRPNSVPENIKAFWEAYDFINDSYYDRSRIDDNKITDETVKTLIKTLDDKHSTYISP